MTEMIDRKLEAIEIPGELHAVWMQGVRREARLLQRRRGIRLAAIAAAAVCAFALPGLANIVFGHFEDVYEGTAITGQRIAQADQDFAWSAETASDGEICICVDIINGEEIAYRCIQQLSLEGVSVTDVNGNTVYYADNAVGDIEDGIACIILKDADLEAGDYVICVSGMKGLSKADAPLDIQGRWQFDIVIK